MNPSASVPSLPSRQQSLQGALQADMEKLLLSTEYADLSFLLNDQPIPAHSTIIAARCHALRPTILRFRENVLQNAQHYPLNPPPLSIQVNSTSEISFRKVLRFIYTGSISLEVVDVYDVCSLSATLGIPSLQNIIFSYLRTENNLPLLITVLDGALEHLKHNRNLLNKLTEHLSENASAVLKEAAMQKVSHALMLHIVKQENLAASELEIWDALIRWSCYQANIIPTLAVSQMSCDQREKIANFVRPFCQPGLLRLLNFDPVSFAEEVEPLAVFDDADRLLKYRFDATIGTVDFDYAFPKDRYNFLLRVRQRTMCFESITHPHPRGVWQTVKVESPRWVSEVKVVFDERTSLGRYSDLEFYVDEQLTQSVFSMRALQNERWNSTATRGWANRRREVKGSSQSRSNVPDPLFIPGHTFWYTFYAPQNVGDLAWGYRFHVSIVR